MVVAALRRRMCSLVGEIGDGALWANAVGERCGRTLWANAALSRLPFSLVQIPPERRSSMISSNSAPACVSDDRGAALTAIRRYLMCYLKLPNYQNYFAWAGYEATRRRSPRTGRP
jgi:hypothetical protein